METGDIFICEQCGLPIRNPDAATSENVECFLCESCDVCRDISQADIDEIQNELLKMLGQIVEKLYRYHHGDQAPPSRFMDAVEKKIRSQANPAEEKIIEIKRGLAQNCPSDVRVRQVAASESVLSGFFYRSGSRRTAIVNSPTVLRHWVALVRKMKDLVEKHHNRETVLQKLVGRRYDLNLARMSKLIGDNPVCIIREPNHYNSKRRKHLRRHMTELIEQTAGFKARIIDKDLKSVLRFAGNRCLVTEYDEVIEFRAKDEKYLCKYLLDDEIMIIINEVPR